MISRVFPLGAFIFGVLVAAQAAEAKTVLMGPLAPTVLQGACSSSGGRWYDNGEGYGCLGQGVTISCAQQACEATVSDTVPVTGNSPSYLLNLGQPDRAATIVGPLDARVSPRSEAQTSAAQKIGR